MQTGGVAAYSSPPPDATGHFNTSQLDDKGWWDEQSNGILTDGAFGNQDIKLDHVPTYCECPMIESGLAWSSLVEGDESLYGPKR